MLKQVNPLRNITALLILVLFTNTIFSQGKQLPNEVEMQIENYKVNAIKNRNAGNENAAATYLNKVAFLYWEYYIYTDAVKYFDEVLTINQNLGNKNGQQKVLDNIAFVYTDMERYDKSIIYFKQSLELLVAKNDQTQITTGISNLALAYNNNGQYNEAITHALEGLDKAKALNSTKLLRSFYGILHESYEKKGDQENSVKYFSLYTTIDKHIQQQLFQEREKLSNQKINQISAEKVKTEIELVQTQDTLKQSKLELELVNAEKKAQEAELMAKEAKIKEEEALRKAQKRLISFMFFGFIFILIVTALVYKQMRDKKKANAILQELNEEIEKKNRQILDSINYASHIQEAILPYEKHMAEDLPDSFVFYKPRDIVSGDFYWHSRHNDLVLIAAVDCTGHGVPGAFMSMIGNTLLNEIVNEKEIFKPSEVLKMLNDKIEFTLNQNNGDVDSFSEDGMDITFCCYNRKTKLLELALANHTAVLISNNKLETVEGDIYSIGGNSDFGDIEYTNHEIKIDADTSLYMFSDGYQDQFGGEKNQKYMVPRFMKFLQTIQNEAFNKHKQLIENEYNNWKGDAKQIDDVLVIGAKLSV